MCPWEFWTHLTDGNIISILLALVFVFFSLRIFWPRICRLTLSHLFTTHKGTLWALALNLDRENRINPIAPPLLFKSNTFNCRTRIRRIRDLFSPVLFVPPGVGYIDTGNNQRFYCNVQRALLYTSELFLYISLNSYDRPVQNNKQFFALPFLATLLFLFGSFDSTLQFV